MAEAEPADAIVLFRPKHKAMLLPFLDLDNGENEEGVYAEELPDGSFLLHTFQPFELFQAPDAAHEWLAQFGVALPEVHDDPRGFLFFPDDHEPEEPATYEDVVKAVGAAGVWVPPPAPSDDDEDDDEDLEPADQAALDLQSLLGMMGGGAAGAPALDLETLQKLAGQLAASAPSPQDVTSFDIGRMFEQVQRDLFEAVAAQAGVAPAQGEEEEQESGDDEPESRDAEPEPDTKA